MATFHPFPRLPFEIRARIWESTVEPRTVQLRIVYTKTLVRDSAGSGDGPREVCVQHLLSSTPVPAALHTCRETRNLGLYQQAFSELSPSETRYVWLNLEIDMISIGTSPFEAFKPVAHLIRRLSFERNNGDEFSYYFEARELHSFVNVREIHVVCPEGIEAWHEARKEHYFPCRDENLFFIDLNDGRMMRSIELDEMCDRC
ncbi:2EXR domain-containing protein [Madurella fahalii]|uniref:2EXR domain-containing protein n=1 Tax=Madurella fahalii TaxID=1157608 RepID=A0ABQ0GH11_9PEZI